LKICLFVFFRTVMIGFVASGLSFFLAEDFSRKELIPLFFPNGRLAAHPGTIKIPLLRRIGVLYGAGTLNPMIILVGTMFFCAWEVSESQVPAGNLLKDLFIFTLVLCIIFVFLGLCLNRLVQRSIRKPLEEILGTIEKIKNGDFSHPMRVISNDEIGVLGDAGNAMIQGLVERERIRDTFGKYVGVEIRDQILAGRIPLKGERRMATLLFSDLRGFTPYVETNAPEQVIEGMRAYFTEMEAAISGNDGLILQYVGDGIEAVFGIHEEDGLHARKAVAAAVEMRQRLVRLNAERGKAGMPAFVHGIGVHTGMVLAGNTGSRNRLSYTLIGETVNLAARIEQLTKELHCDILISQQTADGLDASVLVCKESPRHVKGCSRPIVLYRVRSVVPSIASR
jgi:class 3 adenylate cyclase